jgi:hypothetical protein
MTAEELDRIAQRTREWGGAIHLNCDEIDALIGAARRGLNYDAAWCDGWMARDMEEEDVEAPPPASLVETLRAAARNLAKHSPVRPKHHSDLLEWKAADEIERLERENKILSQEMDTVDEDAHAEIARLRRALQEILNYSRTGYVNREIARAALGEKE